MFVASLGAVVVLNRSSVGAPVRAATGDGSSRHGFRLEESAKRRGIDFVHQAPTFDAPLEHIMPQVAAMGAAVAVADFDRDGWQDFYVTNSGEGALNRLYRNKGDGTFADVAAEMGVADVNRAGTGVSMGAVWGDYDNDGFEDLFLYKYGRPELFRNDAGRAFVRVSERAGLPAWVNANAAIWLDYDRDGRLDLFLAGYWSEDVDLWHLKTTRIMPESFEYAENGGRKYLFRNRGDGTFEESSAALGIQSRRWTLAAAAADLSARAIPDLFLANDYGVAQLYANEGGKRFVEVGAASRRRPHAEERHERVVRRRLQRRPPVDLQDQHLRAWRARAGQRSLGAQGARRRRRARVREPRLDAWASTSAAGAGGRSSAISNNDGTLDLYLVNGYVSAGERTSYWYDFAEIAVGHSRIIGDAANWPAMRGRSLSGYQRKRVWMNDGVGRFTEVAQVVGATDTYDGRAVALADLSNRGALDVIVANQRGPLLVYANTVSPGRHWIAFELEGTASNRSAIGARVEVHWNGQRQVQEVSGGSGFSAQNQRRLHYGLGASAAGGARGDPLAVGQTADDRTARRSTSCTA